MCPAGTLCPPPPTRQCACLLASGPLAGRPALPDPHTVHQHPSPASSGILCAVQAAYNAFLTAGTSQVVKDIQQGRVGEHGVAAAVSSAQQQRVAAAAGAAVTLHDWQLAEEMVRQEATAGEIKVGGGRHRSLACLPCPALPCLAPGAAADAAPQHSSICQPLRRTPGPAAARLRTHPPTRSLKPRSPPTHPLIIQPLPPLPPLPPRQVLSVDDDPINQMVIQTMLSKAGFKVLKAADGQKALDMLEVGAGRGHGRGYCWGSAADLVQGATGSLGTGFSRCMLEYNISRSMHTHGSMSVLPAAALLLQDSLDHGSPPHIMLLDVMMPGLSG